MTPAYVDPRSGAIYGIDTPRASDLTLIADSIWGGSSIDMAHAPKGPRMQLYFRHN